MRLHIGVEDFAQIKSANIIIGDFILFVGENNTGKTLIMQLVYGILERIEKLPMLEAKEDENDGETHYVYDEECFANWINKANDYLAKHKEQIIEDIFSISIPIGKLLIDLERDSEDEYQVTLSDISRNITTEENTDTMQFRRIATITRGNNNTIRRIRIMADESEILIDLKVDMSNWILKSLTDNLYGEYGYIYLPASRTGVQMLYRYFFSSRSETLESIVKEFDEIDEEVREKNKLNLTKPIYNYLQFLQSYNYAKPNNGSEEILSFIEENLLEGKYVQMDAGDYFKQSGIDYPIPMYMASSMINEVTPFVKICTSARKFRYIFCDEIETCLHPAKQWEMARLMVRMVNAGFHIIISTHSDSFAAMMNNLLLLSQDGNKASRSQRANELQLDGADILNKGKDFRVYQFTHEADGCSVNELEFMKDSGIGYFFQQFNDNIDKIYNDAKIISGDS